MTDPFWPDDWKAAPELPAFRVQREKYGPVLGGDYVRGPSGAKTALRYPSAVPGYHEEVGGRSTLFVRPRDYHTAEITWDWPHADHPAGAWEEMALVRSAFGFPSTTNDGETVYRAPRTLFATTLPNGEPGLYQPPIVDDIELPSGRWYYYTLFFRVGPLDWHGSGGMMTDSVLIPLETGHSEHLYDAVPPYYQWVDDNMRAGAGPLRQWLKVFGFELDQTRSFVDAYQELYHFDFSPMPLLKQVGNNIGVPYESALGDIRYRSLLAQIGKLYHIRGTAEALEKVCEAASKYECDVTPGRNLLPLPDDSDPYWSTGNWASVHADTWTASGLVTVPLDAPLPYAQVRFYLPKEGYPAAWDASYPATPPVTVNPPTGGRGVLRIDTVGNDTQAIYVGIGDGLVVEPGVNPLVDPREVIPLYGGIPVKPGLGYGFSFYLKTTQPLAPTPLLVTSVLVWIAKSGQPTDVIGVTVGNPTGVTLANGWEKFEMQGVAPANAVYLVPSIHMDNRTENAGSANFSYAVDLASILVYTYGEEGGGVAVAPDRYLTLGDPNEMIGAPRVSPPYPGFVMGSPLQPGQQQL